MEMNDEAPPPGTIPEPWQEPVNATTQSNPVLQNEEETIQPTPPINPNTERRNNALAILRLLCESNVFSPHLLDLLTAKYVNVTSLRNLKLILLFFIFNTIYRISILCNLKFFFNQ